MRTHVIERKKDDNKVYQQDMQNIIVADMDYGYAGRH